LHEIVNQAANQRPERVGRAVHVERDAGDELARLVAREKRHVLTEEVRQEILLDQSADVRAQPGRRRLGAVIECRHQDRRQHEQDAEDHQDIDPGAADPRRPLTDAHAEVIQVQPRRAGRHRLRRGSREIRQHRRENRRLQDGQDVGRQRQPDHQRDGAAERPGVVRDEPSERRPAGRCHRITLVRRRSVSDSPCLT
jgi:hypothetical protein